jgi:UDP-N-acetylglucosamine:LPS N-acetylglucosamine transferase
VGTLDFDRPWAQPEIDLFISFPGEIAAQLKSAGVPPEKILECGMPVDAAFGSCGDRPTARARLGLAHDLPLLLVNFGGGGKQKVRDVVTELRKIQPTFQVVFISRRDEGLRKELLRLSEGMPHVHVLRWVDNLHEWMAAADLLVSRGGNSTVAEALNSGLPIVVFYAAPGNERRVCQLIEKSWQTGYWVKRPHDLAARINRLLTHTEELERLRSNARRHAHPHAARDAAEGILNLLDGRNGNGVAPGSRTGIPMTGAGRP